MATENTITAILYTPVDELTGVRKRILIQADSSQVIDPATGKTLVELIKANTYSEATETKAGLMSPTHVVNLNTLMKDTNVISETDPGKPCMWYQIDEIEEIME